MDEFSQAIAFTGTSLAALFLAATLNKFIKEGPQGIRQYRQAQDAIRDGRPQDSPLPLSSSLKVTVTAAQIKDVKTRYTID